MQTDLLFLPIALRFNIIQMLIGLSFSDLDLFLENSVFFRVSSFEKEFFYNSCFMYCVSIPHASIYFYYEPEGVVYRSQISPNLTDHVSEYTSYLNQATNLYIPVCKYKWQSVHYNITIVQTELGRFVFTPNYKI